MGRFAKGKYAKGQCKRCGFPYPLKTLRKDGQNNLLVCPECYDIEHPSEQPVNASDATGLARPSPDLDRAASTSIPTRLAVAEGWTSAGLFGGLT